MIPVISIVGRHNSGKTTLLTALLGALNTRGIKAAVIKHSHSELSLAPDNDAHRLFNAEAEAVYAVSAEVTLRYRRQPERELAAYLDELADSGVDIIITEGYKNERFMKIEVLRQAIDPHSLALPGTIAQVADFPLQTPHPVFPFTATEALCEFILDALGEEE